MILASLWGASVRAQELEFTAEAKDLSELMELLDTPIEVWVASKVRESLNLAPATVTVVQAKDIEAWGYTSVADVLRHVQGFYVVDDHIMPNVGVRGVAGGLQNESSNIKVMIDGTSVAFRTTGGNWTGPELLPLSVIERIEIVRGPGSALYGADAFLGVVNIVTRKPDAMQGADMRATALMSAEQNAGGDVDVAVAQPFGDFKLLVAGRLHQEDRSGLRLPGTSPRPVIPTYRLGAERAEDLLGTSRVGLARLVYTPTAGHELTVTGQLMDVSRGGELAHWAQVSNGLDSDGRENGSRIALWQGRLGADYRGTVSEKLELNVRGVYFQGGPTDADRIEVNSDFYRVRRRFGYRGAEGGAELAWHYSDRFSTIVGTELSFDREIQPGGVRELKFDAGGHRAGDILSAGGRRPRLDFLNVGVYGQVRWRIIQELLALTSGVRFDYHNIYEGQPSARLGLVFSPTKELVLKVLYGSAFKAPSPLLLYGQPLRVNDILGNEQLKPQFVHTAEVTGSYVFSRFLSMSTGLSYSLLMNKAEFTPEGANQVARNLSRVGVLAWEIELLATVKEGAQGYARGELIVARRETGESGYRDQLVRDVNPIYPDQVVRLGVRSDLGPTALVQPAVEAVFVSERRSSDANSIENGAPYRLDPYVMLDATLTSKDFSLFQQGTTVFQLIGKNLLGVAGPDAGFSGVDYPLAPRTIMLMAKQRL